MNPSAITFIINGATYRVSADDSRAIRNIPETDRTELIALLEAVQAQDKASKIAVQSAAVQAAGSSNPGQSNPGQSKPAGLSGQEQPTTERLGSGDIDALMAKLIMEEKRGQKPGLTKQGVYKVVAVFAAIIILFVVLG